MVQVGVVNAGEKKTVIEVRRARTRRVSGWVLVCSECGTIGHPTIQRWTKLKAKHMAAVHANQEHSMESVDFRVDERV